MLSRNAAPQKRRLLSQFVYVRSKSLTKKKTAYRSLLFLAGAVGIEPTP